MQNFQFLAKPSNHVVINLWLKISCEFLSFDVCFFFCIFQNIL